MADSRSRDNNKAASSMCHRARTGKVPRTLLPETTQNRPAISGRHNRPTISKMHNKMAIRAINNKGTVRKLHRGATNKKIRQVQVTSKLGRLAIPNKLCRESSAIRPPRSLGAARERAPAKAAVKARAEARDRVAVRVKAPARVTAKDRVPGRAVVRVVDLVRAAAESRVATRRRPLCQRPCRSIRPRLAVLPSAAAGALRRVEDPNARFHKKRSSRRRRQAPWKHPLGPQVG